MYCYGNINIKVLIPRLFIVICNALRLFFLYFWKINLCKKSSVVDLIRNVYRKHTAPLTGSNTAIGMTRTQTSGVSKCADKRG
jgi:hypothetical protein